MTIPTYRYFVCPSGHQGTEQTSENDQPYSAQWRSITKDGLIEAGTDSLGDTTYVCQVCKQPMSIPKAKERSKRRQQAQELIARIRKAFAEVKLGNGIGLWQAQGLDNYASEEKCAQYREKDEKDDWSQIPVNDLNHCNSSLCFFDDEGMRFHLPAYLVAELQGTYKFGMSFQLSHLNDLSIQQYSLLTNEQREIVCDVALYLADEGDDMFDRQDLLRAVDKYWAQPCGSK